jgi:CBS domain-containing protein
MTAKLGGILRSVRIDDLPRRRVCRVAPSTTLGEVYRLLDEEHGVAVLVEEDGKLVGIFTERDILNRTALEGDPETPIEALMTRDLVTMEPTASVGAAITLMTERRIRHLPLVGSDGRASGMIGGRDILRLLAEYFPETLLNLPPQLDQELLRPEGG